MTYDVTEESFCARMCRMIREETSYTAEDMADWTFNDLEVEFIDVFGEDELERNRAEVFNR